MKLFYNGTKVRSVFGLRGADENSATGAIAWTLQMVPAFAAELLGHFGYRLGSQSIQIEIQKHHEFGGYTDIEILVPGLCHLIVEAKRDWALPTITQLERYAPRFRKYSKDSRHFVALSNCSSDYANRNLPKSVSGFKVAHLSWRDINSFLEKSNRVTSSFEGKLWLRTLSNHLREYMNSSIVGSNLVYVVSLSHAPAGKNKSYSFVDVILKDNKYFHPVGGSWPVQPPNYIAFRYDGIVHSVHHIESVRVAQNLEKLNSNWPKTSKDHFVYSLGPAMRPAHKMKSGNVWHRRYYVAIDTLLSGKYESLAGAIAETKKRTGV